MTFQVILNYYTLVADTFVSATFMLSTFFNSSSISRNTFVKIYFYDLLETGNRDYFNLPNSLPT